MRSALASPSGLRSFQALSGGSDITEEEWDATYLYLVFAFVKRAS